MYYYSWDLQALDITESVCFYMCKTERREFAFRSENCPCRATIMQKYVLTTGFFKQKVVVQYYFLILDSKLLSRATFKNNCLINCGSTQYIGHCACVCAEELSSNLWTRVGGFIDCIGIVMWLSDHCYEWGLLHLTQKQWEPGHKIWSKSAQGLWKWLWQLWLLVFSQWLPHRFCLLHKSEYAFSPSSYSVGWSFESHNLT